jgi:hypothetical protein
MNVSFEPVLRLEIWHDFFLGQPDNPETLPANYDISNTIALVPTRECQTHLKNLRWIFRPQPYGMLLLAQVSPEHEPAARQSVSPSDGFKPFIPVDPNLRLTFGLAIKDSTFTNYTNLPIAPPPGKPSNFLRNQVYYFSNWQGSEADDQLYLTQSLQTFGENPSHALGDLITFQRGSQTLEAAQSDPAKPTKRNIIDLNSNTQGKWLKFPASQYVSAKDYLPRQGLSHTHTLTEASPGKALRFSLLNCNGKETLAQTVQVPDKHPAQTPLPMALNFAGQAPGYYRLRLNDEVLDPSEFVLLDPFAGRDIFALVELSLDTEKVPAPFQLIKQVGDAIALQPKTYRIRFKNRATRWRYRCDRPHKFTDDSLPANLEVLTDKTYATKYPVGLRQQPKLQFRDGNDKLLPAASAAVIHPEVEPSSRTVTAIYSDIYL